MRQFFVGLIILFVIILFLVAGVATSWFGLVVSRPMQEYAKETERRVYMNSVAHQQGADSGIAQDCANMESNTGPERIAFARFVLADAAAYAGNRGLSDDSMSCVAKARAAVSSVQ